MTREKLPDEQRRDRRIVAYVTRAEEHALGQLGYRSLSDALREGLRMLLNYSVADTPAKIPLDKTL